MTPLSVITGSPQVIKPEKIEFRYVSPKALATGGICNAEKVVLLIVLF